MVPKDLRENTLSQEDIKLARENLYGDRLVSKQPQQEVQGGDYVSPHAQGSKPITIYPYVRPNSAEAKEQQQADYFSPSTPQKQPAQFYDYISPTQQRTKMAEPTAKSEVYTEHDYQQDQQYLRVQARQKESAFKDIIPSKATMEYAKVDIKTYQAQEKQAKPASVVQPAAKMATQAQTDKRAKIMVGLYLAVAIVLLVTIIVSGIAVSNLNNNVNALQDKIASTQSQIAEKQMSLDDLSNEQAIEQRAKELGMTEINLVLPLELVPINAPQQEPEYTNWFDKLCDFLGRLVN